MVSTEAEGVSLQGAACLRRGEELSLFPNELIQVFLSLKGISEAGPPSARGQPGVILPVGHEVTGTFKAFVLSVEACSLNCCTADTFQSCAPVLVQMSIGDS